MIPEVAAAREIDWENRSAYGARREGRGEDGGKGEEERRRKSNGEWNR